VTTECATASVASPVHALASGGPAGRTGGRVVFAIAVLFLLANLAVRGQALVAGLGGARASALVAAAVAGFALLLARPSLTGPGLELFASSFIAYGFHAYRPTSQVLDFIVAGLSLLLLLQQARAPGLSTVARAWPFWLLILYASLAAASLLLLPREVLDHRLFVEGSAFGRAVVESFPKDPLYAIASVDRLWLFLLFSGVLAAQPDARELLRRLFRGVAWAALAAALLGLLDFAGLVSLDRYNLSHLFYGRQYRRLQSTFGNPSWFACFAACALPFVLLRFHEARGWMRWALAAVLPAYGAALFLSAARAAWLAALVVGASVLLAAFVARRRGQPSARADAAAWIAVGATVATVGALAAGAVARPGDRAAARGPVGRLEGLTQEMQIRGAGLNSPRRVTAAYARELARNAPLLGLGYETFNMHLRAQLELATSGVASVARAAAVVDPAETLFDDSHSTYLQVLTGTGAVGLGLWIAAGAAGIASAWRAGRGGGGADSVAVLVGLLVFHFYGLFQGMAYIPVTFLLLPLLTAYAVTLDQGGAAPSGQPSARLAVVAGVLLVAAGTAYASDTGYASLKRRFGVAAYLPEEREVFEGFYRPEAGPSGEFRWMRRRAIVNVARAQPFRLRFVCQHPDADREPVLLALRFDGRDAGQIVFRRPGAVEQRFDLGAPGALRLSVSRTFRPAGDPRELGVTVSAIRWE